MVDRGRARGKEDVQDTDEMQQPRAGRASREPLECDSVLSAIHPANIASTAEIE